MEMAARTSLERSRGLLCRVPIKTEREQLGSYLFFCSTSCHWLVLDGFDCHFQASVHFTLSSAVNKSQRHQKIPEKFFWECRESNPGLLGEKQECFHCPMQLTPIPM